MKLFIKEIKGLKAVTHEVHKKMHLFFSIEIIVTCLLLFYYYPGVVPRTTATKKAATPKNSVAAKSLME